MQISISEKYHDLVAASIAHEGRTVPIPDTGEIGSAHGESSILLHWGLSLERFEECSRRLARVEWIHTFWAGTERIVPIVRGFPGSPRLTDSRGLYDIPVAEHVCALILGLSRRLHLHRDARSDGAWRPLVGEEIHGKTAVILGAGGIGRRTGTLLGAFGVEVVGIRRRPVGDEPFPVHPGSALDAWLPRADILVVALPETPDTIGLLDSRRLRALPRGALLVNVGRGRVLDEATLVELLDRGWLGGAALDVFSEEPLQAGSPLWKGRDLWITPHCAGLSPAMNERRLEFFGRNLAAFRRGEALENEVSSREE